MTNAYVPMREMQAIDLAASFNASKEVPYVAVLVVYGKGKHSFGVAEFKTLGELGKQITKEAKRYELPETDFTFYHGHNAAVITFTNKKIRGDFNKAMLGHNVEPNDLIVQVAEKSPEWHYVAGQYIAYTNRARREEKMEGKPLTQMNVSMFRGTLVDYAFPDLASMKEFCERVNNGHFDAKATELKNAVPPAPQTR